MKATVYDSSGKKSGEIVLPELFNSQVREDLSAKYYEVVKLTERQPYSNAPEAGKRHSASGTISHRRHMWGGHYGKGISRVPRKTMWRRGTQFYWVATEVSGTRGGRRVHGPVLWKKPRTMNLKEGRLAFTSAIAATASKDYISKRYPSMSNLSINVPLIVNVSNNIKTKEFLGLTKTIFGENVDRVWTTKSIRAGKGKTRGRKYKTQLGLLFVKGSKENINLKGVDVKDVKELSIMDLYPLGRLTMFTEQAIKELPDRIAKGRIQ